MNKQEFFAVLKYEIRSIPKEEQEKAFFYYREIIDDAIEDGATEEEAIARLGSIEDIAREIYISNDKIRINKMPAGRKLWVTVLLVLGFPIWGSLLIVFLILIAVAFVLLFIPVFVLAILAISLFASGIYAIAGTPFLFMESVPYMLVQLGMGISALGLCVLSGIGFYKSIGWLKNGGAGLIKSVKKIFSRGVIL